MQGAVDPLPIRRKPIPNHEATGPNPPGGLRPNPITGLEDPRAPHLRFVRSTTDLTPVAGDAPGGIRPSLGVRTAFAAPSGTAGPPVDFILDGDDRSPATPGSLFVPGQQQVRRVKSSSALSITTASPTQDSEDTSRPKTPSRFKSALDEAQYFATGLVSHPVESTRHFSVIRHCHALVWYRGPSTSVSITILSDEPLAADRTLWLQDKGYSGNMGMALKAMVGTKGNWIDVTPVTKAAASHLPEAEERSIQRDIRRFEKKATGRLKGHIARETHVVRIPATATDGYFRLVVCSGEGGKKTLCGSPVFRIASTSTDAAVVRGASLSTMPLELGVKVATTVGQRVARTYAGVAGAVVENRAKKFAHTQVIRKVGQSAFQKYHASGMGAMVDERWQKNKRVDYDPLLTGALLEEPVSVIGSDAGPDAPFPFKFEGKVAKGNGHSTAELGIPTANLVDVPDAIRTRLNGVFAAWARVCPRKGLEDVSPEWHEAIVTIAPLRTASPGVIMHNVVVAHIIHDFEDISLVGAKLKILLMGYLHPAVSSVDYETAMFEHARDVMTTIASLAREEWAAEETAARLKGTRSERTVSDRLDDATGKVAHQVGRIPLHWAGVRSEAGTMRDQIYGRGGMWIPR